jgi:FolB domain-containing protein
MPEFVPNAYAGVLALHQIHAEARLGVGEEERRAPQTVVIDVRLYLPRAPAGALSDNADYICYHGIGQKIHALCAGKEYRLIEYLTHEVHRLLRTLVPEEVKISVRLRKPRILLAYVQEGASYGFSDLPPHAWTPPE